MLPLLSVGDISFLLTSQLPDNLNLQPEQGYAPFEGKGDPGTPDSIRVAINFGPIPQTGNECLFSSGEAWSVYRQNSEYIFSSTPAHLQDPIWVARTGPEYSRVTIHVHKDHGPQGSHPCYYPLRYPLDQILLIHYLGCRKGLIIHCAGLFFDEKIFLFIGKSGAGKTTISRCLAAESRFTLFSDDRMIVRDKDGVLQAWGTPWPGEGGYAVNRGAKLAGIFFLHQATENSLGQVSPGQAFEQLIPTISVPWYHRSMVLNQLDFAEKLLQSVPAFDLYFTPGPALLQFLLQELS